MWVFGGIPMKTKKVRRHSGYYTPNLTVSKKELVENDLFVGMYYDDWIDYRDGQRDVYSDFKKIKKQHFDHALTKITTTLPKEIIEKYETIAKQLSHAQRIRDNGVDLYK